MSTLLFRDCRPSPVPLITRAAAAHVDRAVAAGELVRIDRGVYAPRHLWASLAPWDRYLARVHAVALTHPDVVFVRESAAALRGFAVFGEPRLVHAVRPEPVRTRRSGPGTRFHAAERMPHWETLGGLRVATADEIVSDAARLQHPAVALAVANSAMRIDATLAIDEARAKSESHPSSRGRRQARWVFERATGVPESPFESVSAAVIEWLGFPAPDMQAWIRGEDPHDDDRVDFLWPEWRVVGEADGDLKYSGALGDAREALRARRARDGRLLSRGMASVQHWAWSDAIAATPLRTALCIAGLPLVRAPEHRPLSTLAAAVRGG